MSIKKFTDNTPDSTLSDRFEELQKRVEYLEDINRFTLDALDLACSFMDFQPGVNKLENPLPILKETCTRISRLIQFQSMALYLVDEKDSDFYPAYTYPFYNKQIFCKEVADFIEQGFFSWAMREKRPLILATSTHGENMVLHVISTTSRVRGMFVGKTSTELSSIPDVSWSLLSIVLSGSANALESHELYKIFRDANFELERSVVTKNRQLEIQASYDRLTGLPNRNMIIKRFQEEIEKHDQAKEYGQVAFMLIDLDMFKDVNETLGHEAGDKLLIQVGLRLREIAHGDEKVARLGGGEFAIIVTGNDCKKKAKATAEKIIQAMTVPFNIDGQILVLDVSIGIAIYPEHGKDTGQILSKADVSMYSSKRRKTGYTVYNTRLDSSGMNRLSLMGELKRSLDRGELSLHFQGKIGLPLENFCGAEALIRWNHPVRGLIPPGEFIPLAEQGGLIKELTSMVIQMAAAQMKEWKDQGLVVPLAINLSARDLQEERLPEKVSLVLEKENLGPEMFEMEITESAFIAAPGRALRVLTALNERGIRLSIDDFGTGYSSIAYLKDLPVQTIKIDRSFVMSMDKNLSDAKIVKSIIDLAHNLDLNVVAEGVENREVLDALIKLGCDMAQGYYIMKPAPAQEFIRWIESWKCR